MTADPATSTQTLAIKVLSCGGMWDLMSEQEASFLTSSLSLFRNVHDVGRDLPRANVSMIRAYTAADLYREIQGPEDLLHLIAHANSDTLQTGNRRSTVTAAKLQARARSTAFRIAPVVVSTACEFQSAAWQEALSTGGAEILIAADSVVSPANLTAFDMAFYAALLSQVRRKRPTLDRVRESFALADKYYRSIHAAGSPFAKFRLIEL